MTEQRSIDFRFIIGVFLKYCWLIMFAALVAGGVTYFISKYAVQKVYRATAQICIMPNSMAPADNRNTALGALDTNRSVNYQEFLVINQLINDINVLASSRNLRAKMHEKLGDSIDPQLLYIAKYRVYPELIRQTRMVNIRAESRDAAVAEAVANAMSAAMIEYIQNNFHMQNVTSIDAAVRPTEPIRPRVFLNTCIGLILGGAGCFLMFFIKETFRGTVDTPDIVTNRLSCPMLGTVTQLSDEVAESRQSSSRVNNIVTVNVDGRAPRFDVAESFRLIRTNLQYSITKKEDARVFVITSTSPKDGKTFIASNLATIIASSGQRVLLLNCDLRKPALHKLFDLDRNTGVVNVLVGEASPEDVVNRNVLDMPLDVLVSGPVPPNPSELLMSSNFAQLVDFYRDKYDYIILDAPPCLNISDAAIIGKLSDGVIYVISSAQTRIDNASHAINQLRALDIPIIGVILNRFSPKAWSVYGYSGYGYGYGYSYYSYSYSYDYGEYAKPDLEDNDKTV